MISHGAEAHSSEKHTEFKLPSEAKPISKDTPVQVGDKLERVMEGTKKGTLWRNEAEVLHVTSSAITCKVYVDVPRTMYFNRASGISASGGDHGCRFNDTCAHDGRRVNASRITSRSGCVR